MHPIDLVRVIASSCEALGLAYFVTGSVASTYYGEYRSTRDVDVVIELPSWQVEQLCAKFPMPDWYVDTRVAAEAASNATMFGIMHVPSAMKIDVMVLRDSPFNSSRLHRAKRVELPDGGSAMFASPEDVILKKLEYFRTSESDKHVRDILAMIRVSGESLDWRYLDDWALRTGVMSEWRGIKSRLELKG